jgi:hypothetical protein
MSVNDPKQTFVFEAFDGLIHLPQCFEHIIKVTLRLNIIGFDARNAYQKPPLTQKVSGGCSFADQDLYNSQS